MNRSQPILVVDDDPGMRRVLERILAPAYPVELVAGAGEALKRLEKRDFALALVDVRLKDGDGYSLCQAIRVRRPETDVILITGSISEPDEKLFRSLEEGAFYFLFKPFDRRVLLALVERCLRLQRERFTKERYAQTLADDLEKARLFQYSLLPRDTVAGEGWTVEGRLLSCDALGGDFYLAQAVEGGLVVSVSDVVGHGVSAAMYAGMLRSTLDAARRRGVDPERVARELLAGIDFFEAATTATLVYALLLPDGRARAFSAGHPPLLWQRAGGIERLPATGLLLHKFFRDRPLPAREIEMDPGDRLLIYTDGAPEARNPADQELGLDRLEEAFADLRDRPVSEAVDELMDLVRTHCGGRPVTDDVTVVMVERAG
ncbi:MAG TPA: SpoIIE family protein phosphatase [Thermoanaerobaculia bacterium]|jgi:sigma-B regulation protein RsbU (phosphoserine phosphatase)|nr:SpoIIE family protein phosphatase [Thermoanaerobaculia bacterium]